MSGRLGLYVSGDGVVGVVCAALRRRVLEVSDGPILQRPLAEESGGSVYTQSTYKVCVRYL